MCDAYVTSLMSRPLDATSVAISTGTRPGVSQTQSILG